MSLERAESSIYSLWTLDFIKTELRRRGLQLNGRKSELVDRLIVSDRNIQLDNYAEETVEVKMRLPSKETYKDLTDDSEVPDFSQDNIDIFLNRYHKNDEDGERLYSAGFLMFVRSSPQDDGIFFNSQCHAEMKAHFYFVDIKIFRNGHIQESHCDCAVGEGVAAHCKHVIAVLYAVKDMKTSGSLTLHLSCTQQLQTFHKPKNNLKGSPFKAAGMPTGMPPQVPKFSAIHPKFKVEDIEIRRKKYNDRVRNIFASSQLDLAIKHRYEPANPNGILNEHEAYCAEKLEDKLLRSLGLKDVSEEYVKSVEAATRDQGKSTLWKKERSTRITASIFKRVCRAKVTSWEKLSEDLIHPREFSTTATEYGLENEGKALKLYCNQYGLDIRKCGLCVSISHPYMAASPDGFCGDETLVEVKCPFSARSEKINEEVIDCLVRNDDGSLELDNDHSYYYQVQGQLFATGRKYANFVVYTGEDLAVIDVPKCPSKIDEIVSIVSKFFNTHHKNAIIQEYLFNGLKRYDMIKCRHHNEDERLNLF